MAQFSKRERVEAALKGEVLDRVPVSAWQHFLAEETNPAALAGITLKNYRDYDWDWVKLNPRATYYAEAWGNKHDFANYDAVLPQFLEGPINSPADLEKIQPLNPTAGVFAEHLDLVRQVRAGLGDTHFLQTVFSPLSVLAFLIARPKHHTIAEAVQAQYDDLRHYIEVNPTGVHEALKNIALTLGQYAAATLESGASGLFFAIVKLARAGILTESEFEEFGKPYDLQVLEQVAGAPFNLLHICGPSAYFNSVTDYPVHALNWATIGQHNPGLEEAHRLTPKTLVGGVDELVTLQTGTPEEVEAEALAAIQATQGRNFLLTPGCGTDVHVPPQNLRALRRAVDLATNIN